MTKPNSPAPPPPFQGQPPGGATGGPASPLVPPPVRPPISPESEIAAARKTARRAQFVAGAALVVSLVSIVTSVSLAGGDEQENDERSQAVAPATASSIDDSPESTIARASEAEESPTTMVIDTRRVAPDAEFRLVYEQEELRIQPVGPCEPRQVDLDEPRVGVDIRIAEFGYEGACGSIKPEIDVADDLLISLVESENATAKDCAESIKRRPTSEPVVPTEETRLCLITSAEAAREQGIPRKVSLVVVTAIAPDGTLTVLVTAWDVPR